MRYLMGKPRLYLCLLVLAALAVSQTANASPKPLDAGTVHVKVLKRGVGNWIAIQERNGVELFGRIIEIDDHSFFVQLHNDPQTTEILYTDVQDLRTGFTTGQKVFMFAGIGAVAGLSIYGFVHLHNVENQPLVPPTPPPFP
jgi:hypothetical protein